MLDNLIEYFLIGVGLICAFCVIVALLEVVLLAKSTRKEQKANIKAMQQQPEQKPEPQPEPAPAPVEPAPQPAPAEPEPTKVQVTVIADQAQPEVKVVEVPAESSVPSGAVVFSLENKQTLGEKYDALPTKFRKLYDEIAAYASAKPNAKQFKNDRYEEYKLGQSSLVRLMIKRGTVIAEFAIQNQEFAKFVAESKMTVKQSSTVLKVTDDSSVQVAKDSIDIAEKLHLEKMEYKKQLAREKRQAKKQQ